MSVFGVFGFADDGGVAVQDAGFDHGFSFNRQGVEFAPADHVEGNGDAFVFVGNGGDRRAGGDFAVKGNLDCRPLQSLPDFLFFLDDFPRFEAGNAQNLERAGLVRQLFDEVAFDQLLRSGRGCPISI